MDENSHERALDWLLADIYILDPLHDPTILLVHILCLIFLNGYILHYIQTYKNSYISIDIVIILSQLYW